MARPPAPACGCAAHGAEAPFPVSFTDLPEQVIMAVARLLDAPALAALCVQDTRLRQLAGDHGLWQALALRRWPDATASHHQGDWQSLYRHRARLPAPFVSCVDRAHALTARAAGQALRANSSSLPSLPSPAASPAGSPAKANVYGFASRPFASVPSMLFDQVMQMLFSLCLWSSRLAASPAAQAGGMAAEVRLVRADMAWWLSAKPEAPLGFARRSCELLGDWDMWGNNFTNWQEVLWRRSALQFLADMHLGPEADVCPSVTGRMDRELERLDEVIRSVDAEGSWLASHQPEGLPAKHWWYACKGRLSVPVC